MNAKMAYPMQAFFTLFINVLEMFSPNNFFTEINLPAIIQIGHCSEYAAIEKELRLECEGHKIIVWIKFSYPLLDWQNFFASDYFVCYNCTGCV